MKALYKKKGDISYGFVVRRQPGKKNLFQKIFSRCLYLIIKWTVFKRRVVRVAYWCKFLVTTEGGV